MKRLWQALLFFPSWRASPSRWHDRPGQEERKERHRLGAVFNGKDIEGWKTFDPKQLTESWYVKEGILYSKGKQASHLFSRATTMRTSIIASRSDQRQGQQRAILSHQVRRRLSQGL